MSHWRLLTRQYRLTLVGVAFAISMVLATAPLVRPVAATPDADPTPPSNACAGLTLADLKSPNLSIRALPCAAKCIPLGGQLPSDDQLKACMEDRPVKVVAATATPVPPAAKGKPLCEEAFDWDPVRAAAAGDTTNILLDHQQLRVSFDQAIKRYESENPGGGAARISKNLNGSLQVLPWLFAEGGSAYGAAGYSPDKVHEYVFLSKDDAQKALRGKDAVDGKVVPYTLKPGTEPKLKQAMADYYDAKVKNGTKDARLTPGDVFYLALKERGGDAREAMLLAHNTLRSLARPGDSGITGVDKDDAFTNKYLQEIRKGDNMGPWYHLFGTAFYDMEVRSDCGWMNVYSPFTAAYDTLWGAMAKLKDALKSNPNVDTPSNRVILSSLTNFLEQDYREKLGGRERDLEKFCFNVWGGEIGAWLVKERLPMPDSPACSNYWSPSAPKPAPGGMPQYQFDMSPVNITWEGGGQKMTLDQKTARITGSFPIQVMPFYEPDEDSWAAAWGDPGTTPYRLTFEAVKNGEMHFFTVDANSGKTMVYAPKIKSGERLTIDMKPNQLGGEMRRSDGSVVEPTTVQVDLKASRPTDGEDPSTIITLSVFAMMAIGAIVVITLLRRRHSATSMVSPSSPSAASMTAPPIAAPSARQPTIASPREPLGAPAGAVTPQGPLFCFQCGSPLMEGARFCPSCGASLPIAASVPKNCSGCGQPLAQGSRFCSTCGTPAAVPNVIASPPGSFPATSQATQGLGTDVQSKQASRVRHNGALFLIGLLCSVFSVVLPLAFFLCVVLAVTLWIRGARKRAGSLILVAIAMLVIAAALKQFVG